MTGGAGALSLAGIESIDAFFSDFERAGNLGFESGDFDLGLAWETYRNPADDQRELVGSTGSCEEGTFVDDSGPAISLAGVEPGDSGFTKVCLQSSGGSAWLWLQSSCPDPGLEKAINATVRYDTDCDGEADPFVLSSSETTSELSGSLCEVLTTLSDGVSLGERCISPDTKHCLRLEWEFPEAEYHNQYAEYEGQELTFTLDFWAEQCRHNPNPADIGETQVCEPEPCQENGPAISWIAFCVDDGPIADGDVEFEILEITEDDTPNKVGWRSDIQLSTVVIYYGHPDGPRIENFLVESGQMTGTATVGEGDERTLATEAGDQSASDPAPNGESALKYEYDDTSGEFNLDS